MLNEIEQFKGAMLAHGLTPPEVIEPGKLHRFSTNGKCDDDAGWCKLFPDGFGGVYGDFRTGLSEHWQAETDRLMTQAERETFRQRCEQERREREAEERNLHEAAALKAAAILNAATGDPATHPYAVKKRVPLGSLVKRGPWLQRGWDDALLVPIYGVDGHVQSIEAINTDGKKDSLKDGDKRGGFHSIGKVRGASRVFIAEGVANAAVGAEVDKSPAVAAMGKSNLLHVALEVRELAPDAELIILADNDLKLPKEAHEAAVAAGGRVVVPELDGRKCDLWDVWNELGGEAVERAIANAKPPARDEHQPETGNAQGCEAKPSVDLQAIIERLVKLRPIDYDRVREAEAKQLGIRVATLDAEVRRARGDVGEDTAQGQAVICPEIEPWPDPVDGAELLNEVAGTFAGYLVLPERAADTAALWAAHAHGFRAFGHSPRLNITAPQKQCGKTLFLDVIETLTPRAQRTENLTTPVLFRLIHKHAPTLLIDEYDTFLRDNEEMRGALNAGHKRGGVFLRCEGDNNEVRAFGVFGPVVLAGIRPLPGTIHDRSIVISMTRAKPGEIQRAFDVRKTEGEHVLNRKLSRWIRDNFEALKVAEPRLPAGAFNRVADNWRPLFAIAFCAGGGWPARAGLAFESLVNSDNEAESYAVILLTDIRGLFEQRQVDKLFSEDIVEHLHTLEDRPWPEWKNGKPITKNQIARLLRSFKIKPGTKREGDTTGKGYELHHFNDAFARFLPNQTVTPSQPKPGAASQGFQNVTPKNDVTDENSPKPAPDKNCDGVTDRKRGTEERETFAL